jgi:hypothetical protein
MDIKKRNSCDQVRVNLLLSFDGEKPPRSTQRLAWQERNQRETLYSVTFNLNTL